jgi:hypothetical protein
MLREELPSGRFGELETVLDRILKEAIESTRRRGRLAPDEVLTEQKSLLAKPKNHFELQHSALAPRRFER